MRSFCFLKSDFQTEFRNVFYSLQLFLLTFYEGSHGISLRARKLRSCKRIGGMKYTLPMGFILFNNIPHDGQSGKDEDFTLMFIQYAKISLV